MQEELKYNYNSFVKDVLNQTIVLFKKINKNNNILLIESEYNYCSINLKSENTHCPIFIEVIENFFNINIGFKIKFVDNIEVNSILDSQRMYNTIKDFVYSNIEYEVFFIKNQVVQERCTLHNENLSNNIKINYSYKSLKSLFLIFAKKSQNIYLSWV